ncbi:helicase HerA domain-containing protein [Desulfosporosinus shakirovi]|uniref:helicase HerA domain-containing protein n=1 Tax=Desulfosporosinus shakirovi TaxID=2885154 RepID=UPI001E2F7048|nr:DUF87 domain-containing protein [Desulfosporosinus sp. SRJS8]MCB8817096.1 DUF87 domain-containing protein [Desulfosporosinus sp. SRJS8]
MKVVVKQRTRLFIMLIYVGFLLLINYLAFGQILPMSGEKGLWFYSGLASVLLGNLLVTPFYTKPVDAISYSVVSIIALYSVSNSVSWQWIERIAFNFSLFFFLVVIVFSFITILTKDSTDINMIKFANTFRILSDAFGNQTVIFSVIIGFALIVFHRTEPIEMFLITIAWAITVLIKPDELLIGLFNKIYEIWKTTTGDFNILGEIAAYQMPGIVLIRQKENESLLIGEPVAFQDRKTINVVIPLDEVGRDESLLVRALILDKKIQISNEAIQKIKLIPDQAVVSFKALFDDKNIEIIPELDDFKNLVGIVATETSLENLFFEVIQEKDLEEGRLVEVRIKATPVLYQVIDGLTKEEIVYQKNTYGYAKAKARKIGSWDETEKKFVHTKWFPRIYSPVFLKCIDCYTPEESAVGHFPGTNYTVRIKDVNHLVTHNTAILGILGVGKSMLSIELVERMIANGIKVICIDLTNQYAKELIDFYDEETEKVNEAKLLKIGTDGKSSAERNVEEGGSINQFKVEIKQQMELFLNPETTSMLKIYNPSKFEVWRQDSKPFNGIASMASLTPPEITQIISEAALELAQKQGMTDNARICLVYEEAHSLVPEWNSVVADGDKSATNGSARAILQGRKYGLGCLLITQRTANVTKTILNQCNTVFAMRTFDDTGKDFLSNYIGSDYSCLLSSLQERHAVFFGKASACENPVLIRLNDQQHFRNAFRKEN